MSFMSITTSFTTTHCVYLLLFFTFLNKLILSSFVFSGSHSSISSPVSSFPFIESSVAAIIILLFTSITTTTTTNTNTNTNTNTLSKHLFSPFFFSFLLILTNIAFSLLPSSISFPIFILSSTIAISLHRSVSIPFYFLILLSLGIIGLIFIYSPVLSSSSYLSLFFITGFPILFISYSSLPNLLSSPRPLFISALINGVFSLILGLSSSIPIPSPIFTSCLFIINSSIATISLLYLHLSTISFSNPFSFFLFPSFIAIFICGLPIDAFHLHPILTSIFFTFIIIPSFFILRYVFSHSSLFSSSSRSGINNNNTIWEYSKVDNDLSHPMAAFTSSTYSTTSPVISKPAYPNSSLDPICPSSTTHIHDNNNISSPHPSDNELDSTHDKDRGISSNSPSSSRKLGGGISSGFIHILIGITGAIFATILAQLIYVPIIPGADPCARTLFSLNTPQSSPGTRVLVTGGAGFIGSNLIEHLLDLGYTVRALDNLVTGSFANIAHLISHPRFQFILGDITDINDVKGSLSDIDYVYHLAAMSKVVPSLRDPLMAKYCLDINSGGSINVLNASRNANIKKVIYAASSTYYGNGKVPMNEQDGPDLLTPYSSSKYEGEIQMDIYDRIFGLPTISVRFFMVYGPRQPTTGAYAIVTGVFVNRMQENTSLPIEGDGSHYRDFIHVRDITTSLILAQQSNLHGMVVNSGTGLGHSVHEVADLVSPNQKHVAPRKHDLVGTLADTCKAKAVLGFQAKRDFVTEMTKIINDAKDPLRVTSREEFQSLARDLVASPWLLPSNSLVHLYRPHILDLKAAAHNAILEPSFLKPKLNDNRNSDTDNDIPKELIVIPFSHQDRELVENTYYSVVKYGHAHNILLVIDNKDQVNECLSLNVACYNSDGAPLTHTIELLLEYGYTVHVPQPGTAYVRSLWSSVRSLLSETGSYMIVPNNTNTGSSLWHNTATPKALPVFQAISNAIKSNNNVDYAYSQVAFFCSTRNQCESVTRSPSGSTKVPVTIFNPPYTCSSTKDKIPTPKTLCTKDWEHVMYMDAACVVNRNPIQVKSLLGDTNAWFMALGTCPSIADSCLGIPKPLLNQIDPWSQDVSCMGENAKLSATRDSTSKPSTRK